MARGRKKANSSETSIRQRAYLTIQKQIATGELPAGSAISELELAKVLGSSRTPIREAISQLVAEGLLEQNGSGSVFVIQLTRENIIDIYELREALERYAVGKVARLGLMRPADKEQLLGYVNAIQKLHEELIASDQRVLDEEQTNRLLAADLSFHALLLGLSQNVRINKVVNDTRLLLRIFTIRREGHDAAALERIYTEHSGLLEAIESRDEATTCRLLSAHIQASQQERLEEYDQHLREASIRKSLPAFLEMYQPLHLAMAPKKQR
ncbi:MAG: GntR family transcriptional regulator [Terracidiphilus sp.]|nr:GntR family transcriptional regulator [Terracidiphilus sp.]